MEAFNPFPDYPVVRLKQAIDSGGLETFSTTAISASRALVDAYASQWIVRSKNNDASVEAVAVSVQGDYGTGKTHLLLDAAARIQEKLSAAYPGLTCLRVVCQEIDAFGWFTSAIGPELKRPGASTGLEPEPGFVERIMLCLYAIAGEMVAGRKQFTEGAVERLRREPEAIRELVKRGRLNVSLVGEELDRQLAEFCGEASANVRRALAQTVWPETSEPALRWLAGTELSEAEARSLQLSRRLSDQDEAAGVLVALAAVHRVAGMPFVLLVDELERLTRYDARQASANNITWLKRVVEGMASQAACVFVSGHFSSWPKEDDVPARFKTKIGLVKLTSQEVQELVSVYVPGWVTAKRTLPPGEAAAIVRNTDGNMRRVLTLCRALFRKSNEFSVPLSGDEIREVALEQRKRLTIDEVALSARKMLEEIGFNTRWESITDEGVIFNVIAYEGTRLRAVLDIRHAVYQAELAGSARDFFVRVQAVYDKYPQVVAFFLFDGNVDDDLLQLLKLNRPFKSLWYDLTQAESMARLAADVQSHLRANETAAPRAATSEVDQLARKSGEVINELEARISAAGPVASPVLLRQLQQERESAERQMKELLNQLERRDAQLREDFFRSLESLENRRSEELQELRARLGDAQLAAQSPRAQQVQQEQQGPGEYKPVSATYAELTRKPTVAEKFRLVLSGRQIQATLLIGVADMVLITLSLPRRLAELVTGAYSNELGTLSTIFNIVALCVLLVCCLAIWSRLTQVDAFFDYSSRTLKQIYLGLQSTGALLKADHFLRDSLERYGPIHWRPHAEDRLRGEFGPLLGLSSPENPLPVSGSGGSK